MFVNVYQLRSKAATVHYMGDPDLMPIGSYENTILVRMFYQISSRLNEIVRIIDTNKLLSIG